MRRFEYLKPAFAVTILVFTFGEPIAADDAQQEILLHIKVLMVDGFQSKDGKLNLAELVGNQESKQERQPVLGIHDDASFKRIHATLSSKFSTKVLAEPTLVTISGRAARFMSGGEIPILRYREKVNGKLHDNIEFKPFGIIADFVANLEESNHVRLNFKGERSRLLNTSKRSKSEIPTLESNKVQADLKLKLGQTVILLENVEGDNKTESRILFAVTPEVVTPLSPYAAPKKANLSRKSPPSAIRLNDVKEPLQLFAGSVCILEAEHNIPRVLSNKVDVIQVTPTSPKEISIQAKSPGTTSLTVWEDNDKVSIVTVEVVADTRQLVRKLIELFPGMSIKVHDINGAILLRGSVRHKKQIAQVTEVAEQYAPRVINHLVAEDVGDTTTQQSRKTDLKSPRVHEPIGERNSRRHLLHEVQLLRKDVRQLIEVLEKKLDSESQPEEANAPASKSQQSSSLKEPSQLWKLSLDESVVIALKNNQSLKTCAKVPMRDTKTGEISIARINADISLVELERMVSNLVAETETKYWRLWSAHEKLNAAATTQRRLHDAWKKNSGSLQNEAKLREQYFFAKHTYDGLLKSLYAAEVALRSTLGLPSGDGRVIKPSDRPAMKKVSFVWTKFLDEALRRSPLIHQSQKRIKALELQQASAKQAAKINGDVLPQKSQGIEFKLPVGFRQQQSKIRLLELQLAKEKAALKELELKVAQECTTIIRNLDAAFERFHTDMNRWGAISEVFNESKDLSTLSRSVGGWIAAQSAYFDSSAAFSETLNHARRVNGDILKRRKITLDVK